MDKNELRCMVIDDSKASRQAIADLIAGHHNLALTAIYRNAIDALNNIEENEVDLIFLDIEMPLMDGFEFMDRLKKSPQIILVCDKPEYALKAFDYDITDYLKKPINRSRFNIAARRALANHMFTKETMEGESINVKSDLQNRKVFIDHINFIEGLGDYIRLVTDKGNLLVLTTIKSFLKKLPEHKFIRIHNSYAINRDKVDTFSSRTVEIGGKEIPVSRSKSQELEKLLMHL